MRAPTILFLLAGAACTGPRGECESLEDCDPGFVCSKDFACVTDPIDDVPPGNGGDDGGTPGEGPDGGPGGDGGPVADELIVDLEADGRTMFADPRPGRAGFILVAEYDVAGGIDRLVSLNAATGAIDDEVAFDFQNSASGACAVDGLRYEDDASLSPAADELWFTCDVDDPFRIVYSDQDLDAAGTRYPDVRPDLVAEFPPDTDGDRYRLAAARGDDALWSVALNDDVEPRNELRVFAPVTAYPWGAVAGVWALTPSLGDDAQDYAAVFDRGDPAAVTPVPPTLVALQRDQNDPTWQLNTQLGARELPLGTTAVHLFGTIETDGQVAEGDNVVAIVPAEGTAYFLEWKSGTSQDGIQPVVYEPDPFRRGQAPDADERILLAQRGTGLFFASPRTSTAWRIPLAPQSADGDVRRVLFDAATDLPNGMVVFDDAHAWFSFADQPEVRRLELIE